MQAACTLCTTAADKTELNGAFCELIGNGSIAQLIAATTSSRTHMRTMESTCLIASSGLRGSCDFTAHSLLVVHAIIPNDIYTFLRGLRRPSCPRSQHIFCCCRQTCCCHACRCRFQCSLQKKQGFGCAHESEHGECCSLHIASGDYRAKTQKRPTSRQKGMLRFLDQIGRAHV